MKKTRLILVLICFLALMGCKAGEEEELPSNHTVNRGGAMHAPGLFQAQENCTGCHGSSLRGGSEAPSCYSCHGKKWD